MSAVLPSVAIYESFYSLLLTYLRTYLLTYLLFSLSLPFYADTQMSGNLLVDLVNQRRVVGLTLLNSSGFMVCASIMEYLVLDII